MKFIYCILAYNEPELLKRTIRRLSSESSFFIIHIQKSVDISPFLTEQENVFFVPEEERIDTIWGDITCVQASLLMFCHAVEFFEQEEGYCLLMSGSDYPVKSTAYIEEYMASRYPTDFFQFAQYKNCGPDFRKLILGNDENYWISYPKTKVKMEIRPRRFIRPRCFTIKELIRQTPQILRSLPEILSLFLTADRSNPIEQLVGSEDFGTSETWMELSLPTVRKLVAYENPKLFERARYLHNPEESLMQNIIFVLQKEVPRRDFLLSTDNRLLHGGALELDDGDVAYIEQMMTREDVLFCRKFSLNSCTQILDKLDGDMG